MANRTVIVDNNTWNNTHIATVGTAMSSPEKAAWEIFNSLDVKYVLVVFGGLFPSFFTCLDLYVSRSVFTWNKYIVLMDCLTDQVLLATPVMTLISSCGWFV